MRIGAQLAAPTDAALRAGFSRWGASSAWQNDWQTHPR